VLSSERPQNLLFLAGAVALTVLAFRELPPLPELLQAPATPFDRNPAAGIAADWRLFNEAAAVIPAGASVCAVAEPRNTGVETFLHREAVALLPGRKILAAALFDVPTHAEDRSEYLIVAGPSPAPPPRGERILSTPRGTVWRRPAP
jgi:hypothetical protein